MIKVFYAPQLDESESAENHTEVLQLSTSDYINQSKCTTHESSHREGDSADKDAQNGDMEEFQVTDDFCTPQGDNGKTLEEFAADEAESPSGQQQDQVR